MADCNETLRELDAFLDSELSEATRSAIHQHLDQCPDCFQAFDFHAELKIVVAQKCKNDEMPPGLLSKLQQCFGDPDLDEPAPRDGFDKSSDPDGAPENRFAATDEIDAGPDGA